MPLALFRAPRDRGPLQPQLGVDENTSARPAVGWEGINEWRANTSHDVTFSYNAAYEGLADSSHSKGEHSKGSLVHDNVTNILYWRNVWASNMERSPLFKGGVHGAIVNNVIFNPGQKAVHYNLMALEWLDRPYEVGKMSVGQRDARRAFDHRGAALHDAGRRRRRGSTTARTTSPWTRTARTCRCSAATATRRRS
jgi:hypothetical protein